MRNKVLPVLVLSLCTAFHSSAQTVLGITQKIADINVGVNGSSPLNLFSYDHHIYFSASNADGRELWKTDGTGGGTVQVKDINSGSGDSNPAFFKPFNGKLYFTAGNGMKSTLWATDGTTAGTQEMSNTEIFDALFPFNNKLIFAGVGANGTELWSSDGTASGTQEIADINTGLDGSYPASFTVLGNQVLFGALADVNTYALYTTDGTTANTAQLAYISVYTTTGSIYPANGKEMSDICVYNNEAFFAATDATHGFELWKTDGTTPGTVMVKDIAAGIDASAPRAFKVYNGKLYFAVSTGSLTIDGLWVSDGTAVGTTRLKGGVIGSGSVVEYAEMNGKLYFVANTKLWETDGTVSGTKAVPASPSMPYRLTIMNGKLYFFAMDSGTLTFTLYQIDDMDNVIPVSFPMSSSQIPFIHTDTMGKYIYFGIAPATDVNNIELYSFKDTVFTVAVSEIAAQANSIYPNPATNSFSVKTNYTGNNTAVNIYSMNGQLQLQSKKTEDIDITRLPAGIYNVQIVNNGQVSVGKLRKE